MSKVVKEANTRQKLVSRRTSNPTPFVNSHGLTAQQLHKRAVQKKVVETVRRTPVQVSRNQPVQAGRERPKKAERPKTKAVQDAPHLLMDVPSLGTHLSVEYPTPGWFNFRSKADVSVVVPLYKSDEVVVDLINSWDTYNDGLNVELIFVDDHCPRNSKDAVVRACEARRLDFPNGIGKLIFNTENKGYGGASNTGADFATGDYIIYLNADTVVTKGWVKPIIDLFKSNPKIGIVGNLQLKEGGTWHGTIDGAGSEWTWRSGNFVHIGRHSYHHKDLPFPYKPDEAPKDIMKVAEREMVTGCCIALPASLNKLIGGFNPNYRIGYWEDADMCLTVREKGYKVYFQPNSVIWHKLSHTGSGAHEYQNFNRCFFHNKWIKSGRIDPLVEDKRDTIPEVNQILIQRKGARGDVLVASYIASALKKKYPGCKITFHTVCPEVLQDHPHIDRVISDGNFSERQFQLVYNLDMIYEYRPYANMLESYADAVGVKKEDCEPSVGTDQFPDLPEDYVVVHAGRTLWVGRDWEAHKFDELVGKLISAGKKVVCVGKEGDRKVPCNLDVRGKTSIAQLAYIMKKADFFVGIDSLPLHLAQAMNTPGVCFFGSILPEMRIYRDNMRSVTAKNLSCLGCHHRKPVPSVVTNACNTGTLECIYSVKVDDFWNEVKTLL